MDRCLLESVYSDCVSPVECTSYGSSKIFCHIVGRIRHIFVGRVREAQAHG